MSGWSIFLIVVLVGLIIGILAWIGIRQMRARHLGIPPPPLFSWPFHSNPNDPFTPAPQGLKGWLNDTVHKFRNPRSTRGAYEETSYPGGGGGLSGLPGRGRARGNSTNALDPDGAWDARVDGEADGVGGGYFYGDEQELGVTNQTTGYYGGHGKGYGQPGTAGLSLDTGRGGGGGGGGAPSGSRGRSRQRELDERYEEAMHGGRPENPFGDSAERSDMGLRGLSPRPIADADGDGEGDGGGEGQGERKGQRQRQRHAQHDGHGHGHGHDNDDDDDDARSRTSLQSNPTGRRSAFREGI